MNMRSIILIALVLAFVCAFVFAGKHPCNTDDSRFSTEDANRAADGGVRNAQTLSDDEEVVEDFEEPIDEDEAVAEAFPTTNVLEAQTASIEQHSA